jgi:cell division protein FtsI (penicillin-binding protein 3)
MTSRKTPSPYRLYFILLLLFLGIAGLIGRLIDLNIINRHFLLKQSDARNLRKVTIPAYRGMILDRTGEPLAISTPVDSICINPQLFLATANQKQQLANTLQLSPIKLQSELNHSNGHHRHEFMYLARQVPPPLAKQLTALNIPGVFSQEEFRRYYPQGEVTAHIVGLTNIDDHGQEGMELAYDHWLSGSSGIQEVLKDRLGHIVNQIELLKNPEQGHDLVLSLDHRIQYLAYQFLKEAVEKYHAESGSAVVMDVKTGEILAMVNQPSYNPNRRPKDQNGNYRNRAVTDDFEPGSVIKPFNIAFALESGKYKAETIIDTNPGWMVVGGYKIQEDNNDNYGKVDLTHILVKSSNIGAAKILLSLQPQEFWSLLQRVGFGQKTNSAFPGESPGLLVVHNVWYPSVVATLSYGYGLAVTVLQLAQAYAVFANKGIKIPVTFLKTATPPQGVQVLDPTVAQTVFGMLQAVVQEGTGKRAQIPGYCVAGKTGTAYVAGPGGYKRDIFMSSFVGIAPCQNPRLVVAVTIRDPKGQHLAAFVAAPIFSKIMGEALRLLDIPPDALNSAPNAPKSETAQ